MAKVTVNHAILALERALVKLMELPSGMEVMGNFDQGGYTDDAMTLTEMSFNVETISKEDLDEDFAPDDPDRPTPYTTITAKFI